jgi:subtilisin-like proprotein convertase family protein
MRTRGFVAALAVAIAATGVAATSASAVTRTFTNPGPITIPAAGTQGPATPYSSEIAVSGFTDGTVQKATVTVSGFSHTFPNDVAALLVGPTGARSIVFAGVPTGGTQANNVDWTFDQSASLAAAQTPLVSGTFVPTGGTPTALTAPAPGPPYPVNFNVFNNTAPNGTWRLFVDDQAASDTGTIARGWSLTLSVPSNAMTLGKAVLNKKKGTATLPVTVGDPGQLTLSGNGVATVASPRVSKAVAVAGPGTVNLPVRATGKKKKKLNSTGKVSVNVTVTFTPTGGTARSTPATVTLKKTLKK